MSSTCVMKLHLISFCSIIVLIIYNIRHVWVLSVPEVAMSASQRLLSVLLVLPSPITSCLLPVCHLNSVLTTESWTKAGMWLWSCSIFWPHGVFYCGNTWFTWTCQILLGQSKLYVVLKPGWPIFGQTVRSLAAMPWSWLAMWWTNSVACPHCLMLFGRIWSDVPVFL